MAAWFSCSALLLSLYFICAGVICEDSHGGMENGAHTEDIAALIEDVLQEDALADPNYSPPEEKNSDEPVEPQVPTLEHIQLVAPEFKANEITPFDIQKFLKDDVFSQRLLDHETIPKSVKEFFRSQRSPVLEAVVPSQPAKNPTVIGNSKALTLKDLFNELEHNTCDRDESSAMFTSYTGDKDDMLQESLRRKVKCVPRNTTQEFNATVRPQVTILNSTELIERLGGKNETSNLCALVLFYAPWCVFSAKAAPHFNAVARVFPQLDVYAINAAHFNKFGTVAVPNILIFHNAKAVARFNNSERVLENIASFVTNITGLEGSGGVVVEELDYIGPLPSQPSDDPDYLLWLSWLFIISFSCYMFSKSHTGAALFVYIGHLGHIEHQHID